ncbi:MAG TPA: efflux RND transporter periplasmic adaptor subunit [Polyangia bacterium]|jgi:membrane fusion protein (multidrug efflux system)|nr:efflux RND transporter periplasmic adaptor subunit [Polyangia bacterium]
MKTALSTAVRELVSGSVVVAIAVPLLGALLFFEIGCKGAPASPAAQPSPPGEVGIVTIKAEVVTLQSELAGRTTASLSADLRPQVSGIIKARTFEEGARVKAGQVLYEIDPAMYRAVFEEARANLASAQAALAAAKLKDDRFASLIKIEGISKQEADDARSNRELATATVAQRQAALDAARINLAYTSIRAPISGRIGKSSVTAGALVTANQPEPLATIRALDPIYVDLTESSEARLKLRAQLGAGTLQKGSTKVKLKLGDGSIYAQAGRLEFAEVAVDEATGSVTLRAIFPNPDETLLPGMYVRAVLDQAVARTAILAPQQGVTHDAKGNATALIVGAGDKVEVRTLVAERAIGDRWLVTSGLAAGDRLIVEGLNKVGPGMPVHATPVETSATGQ